MAPASKLVCVVVAGLVGWVGITGCGTHRDEPSTGAHDVTVSGEPLHCSSDISADVGDPRWADVYRFDIAADGVQTFALELGTLSLFTEDEDNARELASPNTEDFGSPVRELLEGVAEIDGEALHIAWPNAELEAESALHAGLFVGTLVIDGKPRAATCWRDAFEPTYRYDAASGHCIDARGTRGRNRLPLAYVRETGNGECNDFGNAQLSEAFGGPVLAGWNVRGADLSNASANFASMPDADFSGAILEGFSFGYFHAHGLVDAHTRRPTPLRSDDGSIIVFGDLGFVAEDQPPYFAWRVRCADRPLAENCRDVDR